MSRCPAALEPVGPQRRWVGVWRLRMMVVVSAVLGAACTSSAEDGLPTFTPATTVRVADTAVVTSGAVVAPTTATPPVPTTVLPATTVPLPLLPIDGWRSTGADPEVFGAVTITDAEVVGDRIIAIGCANGSEGSPSFRVWVSEDAVIWEQATGPAPSRSLDCMFDVVDTPFGVFAHGFDLVRSVDGQTWEAIEFLTAEGHSVGNVEAIFPTEERLTVLLLRAAEAETRIATLFTTTDGANWVEGPAESAALFDNAGVGDVLVDDVGLLAVGASPWGEFVPTAAVWSSADGLNWDLVTLRGSGFTDSYIHAITATDDGYLAVGGNPFDTNLMASWFSSDGISWQRLPSSVGDTAAEFGYMEAVAITKLDIGFYAAGRDFDAARSVEERSAIWTSPDGSTWEREPADLRTGLVPFNVVTFGSQLVGFWPPPRWHDDEPVQVFSTR